MKTKYPVPNLPCACATTRHAARALTQLYDSRLRGCGIEAPQFSLLMMLDQIGPANPIDIGRRISMDKTTVSRNLRLLERYGWIESTIGTDRRVRQFALTAAGRERLAAALPAWNKVQAQLRAAVAPEAWDMMFRVSRLVAQAAHDLHEQK